MTQNKISIVIVDDHRILASGLKMLLEQEEDMEVVGEAEDAQSALSLVEERRPDCVLLDISLPDRSGLEIIGQIIEKSPSTRILMLTMHEDQSYLQKAMDHGAAGFVLKRAMDSDLIYAIRAVMRGECYIHPRMLKGVFKQMASEKDDAKEANPTKEDILWNSLSPREREVIEAVAKGYTSKEIAERCYLSEKTVSTYRSRAMAKLGVKNRASIVKLVKKLGLL